MRGQYLKHVQSREQETMVSCKHSENNTLIIKCQESYDSLALIRRATSFSQLIHGYRRNSMRFTDSRNWCPIWPPISKQQPSHFARGSRRSPPPPPPSFNAEKGKNTEKGKGWGRKETWIEDDTTPLIPSHVKQKMVFFISFFISRL